MLKKSFQIEGMHCTSCALGIDEELEELKGIKSVKTSYARQRTEVEFDEKLLTEPMIIAAITKAGYKASLVV